MNRQTASFTKYVSYMLLSLLCLSGNVVRAQECDEYLTKILTQLNVTTNSKYLDALDFIYSSTSQQQVDERTAQNGGITIPAYATAEYEANRTKVREIKNRVKADIPHEITKDEFFTLSQTYTVNETAIKALSMLPACWASKTSIPYLQLTSNTENEVVATLYLANHMTPGAVTAIDVAPTSNLKQTSDVPGKVKFQAVKALTFKRADKNRAIVNVTVDGIKVYPLQIPAVDEAETVVQRHFEGDFKVYLGSYDAFFDLPGARHIVWIPKGHRADYSLTFSLPLGLNGADVQKLKVYLVPTKGGFSRQKLTVVTAADGTLTLEGDLTTAFKLSEGRIHVEYEEKKPAGVANR
ncbi:hypothetical protein [Polluticoccus soli]|uniref:hypothetical protein n=1 Tax=Polluticoccus soli TaxID=3034150 RepID=UPI0023E345EB|nr:hypothetical protein [Flavipsychrobacter sp. JY13-12]